MRTIYCVAWLAFVGACSSEAPVDQVTVTRGERTATAVSRDGVYYASVVESGRLVFDVDIRGGNVFHYRVFEHDVAVVDDQLVVDGGKVDNLDKVASFALLGYNLKSRERRTALGLAVEQDRPGCDMILDSCGPHGVCCDRHDKCLEDANDTSQSRAQLRLRRSNTCDAEAFLCVGITAAGIGAGPSDCCSIPGPGSPTCAPAGTYVQSCGWNNCCNGAVDFVTNTFCSSPYNPGYCIPGPNREPFNFCQTRDAEWSTWGSHGPPNYWSQAVCRDGTCSPGEVPSGYDSYDGNCRTDCGPAVTCDWHDCRGTCNGDVWNDACGVCGGDGSSCCSSYDCNGTCNGTAQVDACGVCGGDGTSCCSWYDCQGTCNGNVGTDWCGVCGGDGSSCVP